jgi:hypothetical protein
MNREMQIIREVNTQAEIFYLDAVRLGDHAAFALGRSRRSQMTGLENVADSALKTADIFDYIKRQTARFPFWRQSFSREKRSEEKKVTADDIGFGERLIYHLEKDLAGKCEFICRDRLGIDKEAEAGQHMRRRVYLLLIRQFVHQMVAEYEFRVSMNPNISGNNTRKGA